MSGIPIQGKFYPNGNFELLDSSAVNNTSLVEGATLDDALDGLFPKIKAGFEASTGWISGGLIGGVEYLGGTTYSISELICRFCDYTDETNSILGAPITIPAQTGIAIPSGVVNGGIGVYMENPTTLFQDDTSPLEIKYANMGYVYLGAVIVAGGVIVGFSNVKLPFATRAANTGSEFMQLITPMIKSGGIVGAGTNLTDYPLSINIGAAKLWQEGANILMDRDDPSTITFPGADSSTYPYGVVGAWFNSAGELNTITPSQQIDTSNYNPNGTGSALVGITPLNWVTIPILFNTASGLLGYQYATSEYTTQAEALANIGKFIRFVQPDQLLYFNIFGYITFQAGCTDWSTATFSGGEKLNYGFGGSAGGTGGAVLSVFGRNGNILAQAGDYAASQITNDSTAPGTYVSNALSNLDSSRGALAGNNTWTGTNTYNNNVTISFADGSNQCYETVGANISTILNSFTAYLARNSSWKIGAWGSSSASPSANNFVGVYDSLNSAFRLKLKQNGGVYTTNNTLDDGGSTGNAFILGATTITGGLKDTNATTAVPLGDATHTSLLAGATSLLSALSGVAYSNSNVLYGYNAGGTVIASGGTSNTCDGYQAGLNLTTGQANTLVGKEAGKALTSANLCTLIGLQAGYTATGYGNCSVGASSLYSIGSGAYNIGLGPYAGYNATGSYELFVGAVQQTTYANDKAYSLMFGKLSNSAGSLTGQQLTINGTFNVNGAAAVSGAITITGGLKDAYAATAVPLGDATHTALPVGQTSILSALNSMGGVSSITGTTGNITASSSTGAVTLDVGTNIPTLDATGNTFTGNISASSLSGGHGWNVSDFSFQTEAGSATYQIVWQHSYSSGVPFTIRAAVNCSLNNGDRTTATWDIYCCYNGTTQTNTVTLRNNNGSTGIPAPYMNLAVSPSLQLQICVSEYSGGTVDWFGCVDYMICAV